MRYRQFIAAAALLVAPTTSFGATIEGDNADQFVAGPVGSEPQDGNGASVGNLGGFTLKIGTVNVGGVIDPASSGRTPVFVFQLPDLGLTADPFFNATLSFGTAGKNANTTVNADLYGLARRDGLPGVLVEDYFLGDLDETDATLIQDNILTPDSPANTIFTTDATGNAALVSFLNAKYESGAGVGQYVYLRLNVDDPMTAVTGYNAHTANDPAAEKNPLITYNVSATENADFDGDGDGDGADFVTWQQNVGTGAGATPEQGDANGDGAVDASDFSLWTAQYGTGALAAPQAVPEPASIALALLAAAMCVAAARRA